MTTNADCIYIGNNLGEAAVDGYMRLGGIDQVKAFMGGVRGVTTDAADAIAVLIDSNGQLGTVSSSIRFKENVEELKPTESFYDLQPVSFNYKSQPNHRSIGFIAEDVKKIFPNVVINEKEDPG